MSSVEFSQYSTYSIDRMDFHSIHLSSIKPSIHSSVHPIPVLPQLIVTGLLESLQPASELAWVPGGTHGLCPNSVRVLRFWGIPHRSCLRRTHPGQSRRRCISWLLHCFVDIFECCQYFRSGRQGELGVGFYAVQCKFRQEKGQMIGFLLNIYIYS